MLTNKFSKHFVVFDCDGTLVDSAHLIIEAMSMVWVAEGLGVPPSDRDIRAIVGLQLIEIMRLLYPGGMVSDYERMAQRYKVSFSEIRNRQDYQEPLYEHTKEMIDALLRVGIKLGVATGKSRNGLKETLKKHGLLDHFVSLKTSDDGPSKPNPTILLDAMRELGVEPSDTVMIGDTVFDITMAKNANVAAIGVNWGYHDASDLSLAGAEVVLQSFLQLEETLQKIWGRVS